MSAPITFAKEEKQELIDKLQRYFLRELDQDISRFDAEFLLDFMAGEIGIRAYNQALADAGQHLAGKMEELQYSLRDLEKFPAKAK